LLLPCCFLNIAKCAEEKNPAGGKFLLLLTWHSNRIEKKRFPYFRRATVDSRNEWQFFLFIEILFVYNMPSADAAVVETSAITTPVVEESVIAESAVEETAAPSTFDSLPLDSRLLRAAATRMGWKEPTLIQQVTIQYASYPNRLLSPWPFKEKTLSLVQRQEVAKQPHIVSQSSKRF
jgi:hypothetical protein